MDRIGRRTYLAVIGAGTIAIAGCFGDEDDGESTEERDETRSAAAADDEFSAEAADEERDETEDESNPEFEIGDRVDVGDLHAVVTEETVTDDVVTVPDGDILEADDGAAFAVVDLALQYTGDDPVIDVDEAVTVELGSEDGETYDRVADLEPATLDPTESRLAPGEVARGNLVYDVDDDTDELVLELESPVTDETAVVELGAENDTDSGAELEQDLDDVLRFSQGVERSGVEVAVTTLEHGNNLGGFMQSDEGYEIVAVGVAFENGSGRDRTLSLDQGQLKDEFGRIYGEASGVVRALEDFDDTTLDDGAEYDGKIAYQIEEGLTELYWVFDFSEWGDERRVSWQLR